MVQDVFAGQRNSSLWRRGRMLRPWVVCVCVWCLENTFCFCCHVGFSRLEECWNFLMLAQAFFLKWGLQLGCFFVRKLCHICSSSVRLSVALVYAQIRVFWTVGECVGPSQTWSVLSCWLLLLSPHKTFSSRRFPHGWFWPVMRPQISFFNGWLWLMMKPQIWTVKASFAIASQVQSAHLDSVAPKVTSVLAPKV